MVLEMYRKVNGLVAVSSTLLLILFLVNIFIVGRIFPRAKKRFTPYLRKLLILYLCVNASLSPLMICAIVTGGIISTSLNYQAFTEAIRFASKKTDVQLKLAHHIPTALLGLTLAVFCGGAIAMIPFSSVSNESDFLIVFSYSLFCFPLSAMLFWCYVSSTKHLVRFEKSITSNLRRKRHRKASSRYS